MPVDTNASSSSPLLAAAAGGEPPGVRQRFPLHNLLRFRRDQLGFLSRLAAEHGDVTHLRIDLYFINHPELAKEVLVTRNKEFIKSRALQRAKLLLGEGLLTSEGEFHLRQRRLAQPAFHRERISGYGEAMVRQAVQTADQWRNGARVDMLQEMMHLTLAIVAETLFGTTIDEEADEIGAALTDTMSLFDRLTLPFGELLDRLPLPATRRFFRARKRLDETIRRIVEQRRAEGTNRGDLLSMLLAARDEQGDGTGMTDRQVRDEALTLLLAGHETTANALAWTWFLLATHPEVEARLHSELDTALRGEPPHPDRLDPLPYTRQVLAEAMRLYPPAWAIGRQPLADMEIGGYAVRAGSIVLISPWVLHRDARFFADPLQFDPDRWTAEREASIPRFAYLPFGAGPRKCIDEEFAWMEGTLVLATLAQHWRARLSADARVQPHPLITLRPRYGISVVLERRG